VLHIFAVAIVEEAPTAVDAAEVIINKRPATFQPPLSFRKNLAAVMHCVEANAIAVLAQTGVVGSEHWWRARLSQSALLFAVNFDRDCANVSVEDAAKSATAAVRSTAIVCLLILVTLSTPNE
jgi:hypothetical protein